MLLLRKLIPMKRMSYRLFASAFQETKIPVGDVNINYVRAGQGPHNLLLLPGAIGSAWSDFKPQIEDLDHSKFTIIAWEPPGYGNSRPPNRQFDKDNFLAKDAEIAIQFLEQLNIKKCSLLGWSDGGITALIMAGRKPELLDKLVIWGSNAYVSEIDKACVKKVADLSKWSDKMKAPLIKMYGEEYLEKLWSDWVDAFLNFIKKNNGNICIDELPKIKAKTLILHGEKDPMLDPVHPGFLSDNIKNSSLYVFKNGKHNIHLRYAEEFNRRVTEFLIH